MNAPARPPEVRLEDKYALQSGRAFMTGTQALVRLPMLQRARDLAAGINTGGFISVRRGVARSGRNGSPRYFTPGFQRANFRASGCEPADDVEPDSAGDWVRIC